MEENKEIQTIESPMEDKDKKIKNLISIVILLAGLFIGSVFVDVVQMTKGGEVIPKKRSTKRMCLNPTVKHGWLLPIPSLKFRF